MEIMEKEVKYQLSKADYFTLIDYFTLNCIDHYVNDQVNYYIDTDRMDLINSGVSIRLRSIDNKDYEFTMKSGGSETKNNLSIKKEFTVIIDRAEFERILDGSSIKSFIETNDEIYTYIKQLRLEESLLDQMNILGKLKTIRTFFVLEEGFAAVNLDISQYGTYEDYELEWETDELEEASRRLGIIFKEMNINPLPDMISKRARFMKTLSK